MQRNRRWSWALAAVAAITVAVGPAQGASRAPDAVLAQNILPGLASLTPTGSPSPDSVIHVAIGIERPDVAGENALYRDLYDPHSASYHQFLSPDAFAARFGVEAPRAQHLTEWLRAGGLTITHESAAHDFVQVTGTVAQIERRFQTTLKTFNYAGTPFFANTVAPTVPADLRVMSVIGLNNWQKFHTASTTRPAAPSTTAAPNTGDLTPSDLWAIYNEPAQNTGQAQTMAVFGWGATDGVINDLRVFEKNFKFRQIPVRVVNPGAGPFTDKGASVEWNIDMQAEQGMSPDAYGMVLYFGHSEADADVATMFSAWVSDPAGPKQANASFSTCERNPGNALWYNPALDAINTSKDPNGASFGTQLGNNLQPVADQTLRQGTLQGQTLFTSTGDTGPGCAMVVAGPVGGANGIANQGALLMGYPAASPYAVAVGGTALYSDGNNPPTRFLERGWEYGGGGTSFFVAAPSYQQGVATIAGRCITDPDGGPGNAGKPCRGIPDVAAVSGDTAGNGYSIVAGGSSTSGGGTSLSSPLWVGMWTRVQAASRNATGEGFANESFYRVGKDSAKYAKGFYDITIGDNGPYPALPGWDYVTGWGVPHVDGLMLDITGTLAPLHNILPPLPAEATACVPEVRVTALPPVHLRMQDDKSTGGPFPGNPSYTYVGTTLPDGTLGTRTPPRKLAASFNEFNNGVFALPTFTSAPLSAPMTIVGDTVIETWVQGASQQSGAGKLEAQVLDVAPDGKEVTLTQTTNAVSIATDPSKPARTVAPLHLANTYTIAAGHKLALAIGVLHSPETTGDTIFYDSDEFPSGLTVTPANVTVVKPCGAATVGTTTTPVTPPKVLGGSAGRLPATGSSYPFAGVAAVLFALAGGMRAIVRRPREAQPTR